MSKNCGHKVPCGCGDQAFTTAPNCDDTGSCAGESCAEVFCQECITNCQPDTEFSISGNLFQYAKGARLDEVLQKLLVFLDDPTCVETVAVGLRATHIGKDKISLAWAGSTANQYRVHWDDGVTPVDASAAGLLAYEIINLVPETEYTVYISTDNSACQSVTLKIKTKPA